MSGPTLTFLLKEVVEATGGVLIFGAPEIIFYGISTDSRLVNKGNLFIALKGEKYDGHDFVQKVLGLGAAGVVVHDEKKILKNERKLNKPICLPQTIFQITNEHELVILEMGTNTRGEIKRLTQIAAPNIGLITNIGPAHLAGFGSIEGVREEKGDLFLNMEQSGMAIINLDDECLRVIADRWKGKRITFGMGLNADVSVKDTKKNGAKGMCFNLIIGGKQQKVEMKIVGIHHVYNAIHAAH